MLLNFAVYYRDAPDGCGAWLVSIHPHWKALPLHDDGMLSRPWPITAPSHVFFLFSIVTINSTAFSW